MYWEEEEEVVVVVVEEEGPERRDLFNENCDISPSLTSRN